MNKVKIIFILRMILWTVAIGASVYWIRWSFKLYEMGFLDETDYAAHFRPIFAKGLFISVLAVCISLILRKISDKIKDNEKDKMLS